MEPVIRSRYPVPPPLRSFKIISGFTVRLTFADGVEREIDLAPYLDGPIFEPIRNDPQLFAAMQIDEASETICWPNGADIAPETLYYDDAPPWAVKRKPRRTTHKRTTTQSTRR